MEMKDKNRWVIPKQGRMKVPGIIYGSKKIIDEIQSDNSSMQVANVACLPGIVGKSLAMPDIHWGYGFPIGGVAAFDWDEGIISPGGVGYDINCGCRLMSTGLEYSDIKEEIKGLTEMLYRNIPTGVGSRGNIILGVDKEKKVCTEGAQWAVRNGYGTGRDLEYTEEKGCMSGADPSVISERAFERGRDQLGTLGSGNHFIEIGVVDEVFLPQAAAAFGLHEGQVTVMIHSGSRGFGYQVCDDFLQKLTRSFSSRDFELPDRQLVFAYIQSREGQEYLSAMACAANYAWANRQITMHLVREAFMQFFRIGPSSLEMQLVYDVAHNIAKKEIHEVEGKRRNLCVHRKGATRAFPAGHPDIPRSYGHVGQPVLIPGDMGRASYVMVGTDKAMEETFGSCCHGAGRLLSRQAAIKKAKGRSIFHEMESRGIIVRSHGRATLAEEMPEAYKDVSDVVDCVEGAGIAKKVVRLKPLGVIKG